MVELFIILFGCIIRLPVSMLDILDYVTDNLGSGSWGGTGVLNA